MKSLHMPIKKDYIQ